MKVRLHPEARMDLIEARNWYYDRSPLSSISFARVVDQAISSISVSAQTYPLFDQETRKTVLPRFPFSIFYRSAETEIVIIAVAHQKRRPRYWSSRT